MATDERFAFLESKKYKIKTMKLSKFNVISQGIALPLTQFEELKGKKPGDDVTDILGITYATPQEQEEKADVAEDALKKKFRKNPLVKKLMRYAWFRKVMTVVFVDKNAKKKQFPEWIVKTDALVYKSIHELSLAGIVVT